MQAENVSFLLAGKKKNQESSLIFASQSILSSELNAQIGQISYVKVRALFENRNQKSETLTLEDICMDIHSKILIL